MTKKSPTSWIYEDKQRVYVLMKLFSVFLFQLLTWFSVQETSIAEPPADEVLTQVVSNSPSASRWPSGILQTPRVRVRYSKKRKFFIYS